MINRLGVLGFGLAALASAGISSPANAQRVSADIHVAGFPVSGVIHVGDPYDYYPRPRHVVVEYRNDWRPWNYRGARAVVVYYDPDRDIYYDRFNRGLREVRVYQYGDRFYRYDEGRRDYDRRYDGRNKNWNQDHDRGRDNGRGRGRDRDRDDRWDRDRDH